jgi:hypothetical protein
MAVVEIYQITSVALQNPAGNWISDKTIFRIKSVASIGIIDHLDFEAAEIVLGLCDPLILKLRDEFEFTFNGSVSAGDGN